MQYRIALRGLISAIFVLGTIALPSDLIAEDNRDMQCLYADDRGRIVAVAKESSIPQRFKQNARCIRRTLKASSQVELPGLERQGEFATPLGRMKVRWPRSAEQIIGTSPEKLVVEAAQAIKKFLVAYDVGIDTIQFSRQWNVLFYDDRVSSKDVPMTLVDNCHPGWMVPPGEISIVAERAVAGCGGSRPVGSRESDLALIRVLIHEFAHAIEYELLGSPATHDRARAEGFASWIESKAFDNVQGATKGMVRAEMQRRACTERSLTLEDFSRFNGSALSYAKASQLFEVVFRRQEIVGIRELYNMLKAGDAGWFSGTARQLRLSEAQLLAELCR